MANQVKKMSENKTVKAVFIAIALLAAGTSFAQGTQNNEISAATMVGGIRG